KSPCREKSEPSHDLLYHSPIRFCCRNDSPTDNFCRKISANNTGNNFYSQILETQNFLANRFLLKRLLMVFPEHVHKNQYWRWEFPHHFHASPVFQCHRFY